jgi:hypothetical protein
MEELARIATRISNPFSLAAFALATIVYFARRRGKVPSAAWIAVVALVATPISASVVLELLRDRAMYEVRVGVIDASGAPIDGSRITASVPGERKEVPGGWEISIPAAAVPADRKLVAYASVDRDFLSGKAELLLGSDHHPTMEIRLARDESATVRGRIQTSSGEALAGASVSVAGYPAVKSGVDGEFRLDAHAARRQLVRIHVENAVFHAKDVDVLAGGDPVVITLEKR